MRCFRSLEYIFKFIIQSRLLFARATGGQNEDSFRVDVDTLFESFAHMLNMHLENIQTSQVCSCLINGIKCFAFQSSLFHMFIQARYVYIVYLSCVYTGSLCLYGLCVIYLYRVFMFFYGLCFCLMFFLCVCKCMYFMSV